MLTTTLRIPRSGPWAALLGVFCLFAGSAHATWFSDEDLRKEVSDYDYRIKYAAVRQFRDKNWFDNGDNADERITPITAVAVGCPGAKENHRVVITPAHAFRKLSQKRIGTMGGIPIGDFRYIHYNDGYEIKDLYYGGEPGYQGRVGRDSRTINKKFTEDWAVVTLKRPLKHSFGVQGEFRPLALDPRKNYQGCVRFVAFHGDLISMDNAASISPGAGLRQQICEIKSSHLAPVTSRGASTVKHNCHVVSGSSGGALIACDTGKLVAINIAETIPVGKDRGSPYSDANHHNRALRIDGGFLEAFNESCVTTKDHRIKLSNYEKSIKYLAVGQFATAVPYTKEGKTYLRIDQEARISRITGVAVGCPGAKENHRVVITAAHAFRSTNEQKPGPVGGITLEKFRYLHVPLGFSLRTFPHQASEIKNLDYGGEPTASSSRDGSWSTLANDWAVVTLKNPLDFTYGSKPLDIDPRKNYRGCVRFVAYHNDFHDSYLPRKETCALLTPWNEPSANYGATVNEHSCRSESGSAGGALVACDSGQLVAMDIGGVRGPDLSPYLEGIDPKSWKYYQPEYFYDSSDLYHYDKALRIEADF